MAKQLFIAKYTFTMILTDNLMKNKNNLRHIICDGTISIIVVLSQTMRYDITIWHHLSLAEPIHRMIPALSSWLSEKWVNPLDPRENSCHFQMLFDKYYCVSWASYEIDH